MTMWRVYLIHKFRLRDPARRPTALLLNGPQLTVLMAQMNHATIAVIVEPVRR